MKSGIVLVGMMGSGKSTVGEMLSTRLKVPFIDTDRLIEESSGKTIPELFSFGESNFRGVERGVLQSLSNEPSVIATGGGTITDEANIERLHSLGRIIYLKANAQVLWDRLSGSGNNRPLLSGIESLESLLKERECSYNRSDLTIETDLLTPLGVCLEIERRLR